MSVPANVFSVDSAQLNNLYFLQNILVQIQKNLTLISFGNTGTTITVATANLFQLAAVYYKDATQWTTIAEANNLHDPEVIAPLGTAITLIIPTKSLSSGGILNP